MKKYAVLTNDLQFAAANKHQQRKDAVYSFLPPFVEFLSEMRTLHIPVIHLQLINADDDLRAIGLSDEQKFTKGSKGAQILEEVLAKNDIVIEKSKDSGFFNTNLDDTLRELHVDTTIITGMQTQICVQTTSADAHFRGYDVIVPSDGVVSTRKEDTVRALEWLEGYCANILSMKQIVDLIYKEIAS